MKRQHEKKGFRWPFGPKERMSELEELEIERENLLTEKSNFFIREAYKTLRTNVMFSLTGESRHKVILVTSSVQSEGKSFTALNLAISFAQMEKQVLLIDCDLRRPKLFRLLQTSTEMGLSNVFLDSSLLDKAICHAKQPCLDVLFSGDVPPNPSELLGSARMSGILQKLREKYEYIILDTPPVNVVTDAVVLIPETDGVLFVVRAGRSERGAVMHAVEQLKYAGGRLLGFVMNDAAAEPIRRRSYYKKGYHYGYGHRDGDRQEQA